jgi:hypothetical protein
LKFDGIGKDFTYKLWADEFLLDPETHDLLRREIAAYEVVKTCGSEDLVPPLVVREVNPVPLLSDAMREKIATKLRIPTLLVDETLGVSAILQMAPKNFDNLAERWGFLGVNGKERWGRASDRLRHSMYRALAIDFLLGTPDRTMASFLYNTNTDRLNFVDLGVSFPHPGMSAERYIQQRAKGWGRKPMAGLEKGQEKAPAHSYDFWRVFWDLDEKHLAECLLTFEQITEGLTDQYVSHLASVLVELEVPDPCVAGFLARVAYLGIEPLSVVKRPFDLLRNVLVPLRKGFALSESLNAKVIEYVNTILANITGGNYDLSSIVAEPAPEDLFFKI